MSPRRVLCQHCSAPNAPDRQVCAECGSYLHAGASPGRVSASGDPLGGPPRTGPKSSPFKRRLLAGALVIVFAGAAAGFGTFLYRAYTDWDLVAASTTITTALTTTTTGVTPSTQAADDSTTTTTAAPRTGEELAPAETQASSFLPPKDGITYGPENLTDGDLSTAWNEGTEGTGVGEWVQFYFTPAAKLERIEIANGYQKDDRRFEGNVRVRVLRVEYSNGESHLVELFDDQGFQSIEPVKKAFDWVRFTIVSVYPNSTWDDAALSEVRFFGEQG